MIVNKYNGNGGGGGGSYVLPTATANRLGGVKVGSGLTITNDGTLSTSGGTYELPVASNQVLGGVKIGSGITIDANGVISAQGGSGEGSVKVYFYDELYSGDTYDHYDMSVPNEMEALAKSGTPVYVLYRGQNKSVYLELTTKTGNTLVFNGADGDGYYSFSLVKNEPWVLSEIVRSNNTKVIFLNKLTEQERLALYNELASKYDYNTNSWTTAFTQDEYAFYIDLRDNNDQQEYSLNDEFEGFFPMQVVRMHPSDYGGAAFFSGVAGSRYGQAIVINIRFVITYDGQVDKGTWWNNPVPNPEYVFNLDITSAGTISWNANWEAVADTEKWTRMAIRYYYDIGLQGWQSYATAPVKWIYNYATEVDSEVKLYYILTADININGTVYTGVWGVLHDHWYGNGDPLCPKLISWTSGSTITDPSYPPYVLQPNE